MNCQILFSGTNNMLSVRYNSLGRSPELRLVPDICCAWRSYFLENRNEIDRISPAAVVNRACLRYIINTLLLQ